MIGAIPASNNAAVSQNDAPMAIPYSHPAAAEPSPLAQAGGGGLLAKRGALVESALVHAGGDDHRWRPVATAVAGLQRKAALCLIHCLPSELPASSSASICCSEA